MSSFLSSSTRRQLSFKYPLGGSISSSSSRQSFISSSSCCCSPNQYYFYRNAKMVPIMASLSALHQHHHYYSTNATPPPRRPFTYKLKHLWLKLTNSPMERLYNDNYFAGSDRFGNEYFEYVDGEGAKRRLVRMAGVNLSGEYSINQFSDQMSGSTSLPMEWKSWLNFVRKEAPSQQEQERLEKERAWRALKAREWDELQMREEIRGGGEVSAPSTMARNAASFAGSESEASFSEYVQRAREKSAEKDAADQRAQSRNMFEQMDEEEQYGGTARGYEQLSLEEARALNDEMLRSRPTGPETGYMPPHAETQIDEEKKRTPHFYPSSSLARDNSLRVDDLDSIKEGSASGKERQHERQTSMNRTSKFLGVRPAIRSDAARRLREKERQERNQNDA